MSESSCTVPLTGLGSDAGNSFKGGNGELIRQKLHKTELHSVVVVACIMHRSGVEVAFIVRLAIGEFL
jgi:hypothetical protein